MEQKEKMTLISSISYDQHEIIQNIIDLHLDGKDIECDPTYGNGSFYKNGINRPKYCSDLFPEPFEDTLIADCRSLIHLDNELSSIMFDPPFLQTTGKGSIIKDRFGSYPTMNDLHDMYMHALVEFHRVLDKNGVLIVKMQNTVMSGKQWWSVDLINSLATTITADNSGTQYIPFRKIDEFILLAKHRMPQHNLKKQRHARKYHCYFLVYRKLAG